MTGGVKMVLKYIQCWNEECMELYLHFSMRLFRPSSLIQYRDSCNFFIVTITRLLLYLFGTQFRPSSSYAVTTEWIVINVSVVGFALRSVACTVCWTAQRRQFVKNNITYEVVATKLRDVRAGLNLAYEEKKMQIKVALWRSLASLLEVTPPPPFRCALRPDFASWPPLTWLRHHTHWRHHTLWDSSGRVISPTLGRR